MKKLSAILLTLALVFAFAACGGKTEPAQPTEAPTADAADTASDAASDAAPAEATTAAPSESEPKDLEIKSFDYYVEDDYLHYVITIHNPNANTAIELPSYRITAKSASGSILGSYDHTLSIIYPGNDFVYASQAFSISEEPADVKADLLPSEDYNIKKVSSLDHPEYTKLTVENTSVIEDGFFTKMTGEIRNDNDYTIDSACVCVVFRDAEGKVVSSDSTFVDFVAGGTTTPFDLSLYSDNLTDTYEVYADIWG